jgi:uncharacterized protein (TIGR03067 family)
VECTGQSGGAQFTRSVRLVRYVEARQGQTSNVMDTDMRKTYLAALVAVIATSACGGKTIAKATSAASTASLDGVWVPTSEEMGGNAFPPDIVAGQKLTITGNSYFAEAESTDRGELKFEANKLDMYSKEGANAGKHFTAIYKLENDQLTICYNLAGDTYPVAFESKSKPMLVLAVFKRVGTAK